MKDPVKLRNTVLRVMVIAGLSLIIIAAVTQLLFVYYIAAAVVIVCYIASLFIYICPHCKQSLPLGSSPEFCPFCGKRIHYKNSDDGNSEQLKGE